MKLYGFVIAGALLLAGCGTAPNIPPGSSSATAIQPSNQEEADLLASAGSADALAEYALRLVKDANSLEGDAEAQPLRKRAFQFAELAIERGSENLLLPLLLSEIQPDGTRVTRALSSNSEADALVHEGEVEFGRGNFDKAFQCYNKALEIDPGCATAALFAGDVYFAKREYAAAIPWFERAISIRPDMETAHRYRADALVRLGHVDEAGDGYIRAFICSPTNPIARKSLEGWANLRGMKLAPLDSSFISGRVSAENGKANVFLESNNVSWITVAYVTARAKYLEEHNLLTQPYRQSLAEEASALRTVIEIAREWSQNESDDEDLKVHSESFEILRQVDREGLLEAHILLNRATADLLKDYPAYLADHGDELAQYLAKYCLRQP